MKSRAIKNTIRLKSSYGPTKYGWSKIKLSAKSEKYKTNSRKLRSATLTVGGKEHTETEKRLNRMIKPKTPIRDWFSKQTKL